MSDITDSSGAAQPAPPSGLAQLAQLSAEQRAYLERRLRGASQRAGSAPMRSVRPPDGLIPLSFAQERMWFLEQFAPGSPVYNRALALRLVGSLDHMALSHSLAALVQRHESLRTTFVATDQGPRQLIAAQAVLPLLCIELALQGPDGEEALGRLLAEAAHKPFDLVCGPLCRALLVRRSADTHILLITTHHIIADGWSDGVLIHDLGRYYAMFAERSVGSRTPNVEDRLARLPIQYAVGLTQLRACAPM